MALTKAKLIELIDNGDIDVGGGGQNLLHNWDFRNPVNQRGASGTISTAGYFYDRWKCSASGITVTSGYVALGLNASIEQKTELNLRGLVVTATLLLSDGTFHTGTGMFPVVNGPENSADLGGYKVVFGTDANLINYFIIVNDVSTPLNVVAVKLELGTVSTLAYDPPMDYGVELAKCQRFFMGFGATSYAVAVAYSTTEALAVIRRPMRIAPSPTYFSTILYIMGEVKAVTSIGCDLTIGGVNLTLTSNDLTIGKAYRFQNDNASSYLHLSADL